MRLRITKLGERKKERNLGLFQDWTRELGEHARRELSRRACSAMDYSIKRVQADSEWLGARTIGLQICFQRERLL